MALIDDFKARFPEFPTADADTYIPILETVWPSYYGGEYDSNQEIVLNLVAHLIIGERETNPAPNQNVASQSVGSVSVSYKQSSQVGVNDDFFNTTKYGQRFLRLTASQFGGMAV